MKTEIIKEIRRTVEFIRYRCLKFDIEDNITELEKAENIIEYANQLSEDLLGMTMVAEDHSDLARARADALTLSIIMQNLWEQEYEK